MRADLLSEAWLRVLCKADWRDGDLFRETGGGLDLFLLVDAARAGFKFLPLPRREPLRI